MLSYFSLLVGSRRLRGLAGSDEGARGDASVRLDVNDAVFITGAACEPSPVWAVIVREHADESHRVAVYTTLAAGEAAYRREVEEFFGGIDCDFGMDHGLGEPCECAGVPEARLDLRALISRGDHCLVAISPESICMCGSQVRVHGLSGAHPTLAEHLDGVVDETLCRYELQPQAAPAMARLASQWRGSLADLVAAANDSFAGA